MQLELFGENWSCFVCILYDPWSLCSILIFMIQEIFVFINTLLEIMTKSTKNQQIWVSLGTAMTNFTEFVTSCKNQQFGAYFLSIWVVHWPNQQNSSKIEIFLKSFWNLKNILWPFGIFFEYCEIFFKPWNLLEYFPNLKYY